MFTDCIRKWSNESSFLCKFISVFSSFLFAVKHFTLYLIHIYLCTYLATEIFRYFNSQRHCQTDLLSYFFFRFGCFTKLFENIRRVIAENHFDLRRMTYFIFYNDNKLYIHIMTLKNDYKKSKVRERVWEKKKAIKQKTKKKKCQVNRFTAASDDQVKYLTMFLHKLVDFHVNVN